MERQRTRLYSYNFYTARLSLFCFDIIVKLLLCLTCNLGFIISYVTHTYGVCLHAYIWKNMIYKLLCTFQGFRNPLGVLACSPHR